MIYFYRAGKGYNLRPDKRMGCGISFSEKDYTLAVLLRSIKYNDEIVFGPSKVAAFIYNKYTGCKFYEDNKKEKLDNIQKIESIRSEERRVGKECRSNLILGRWRAHHYI